MPHPGSSCSLLRGKRGQGWLGTSIPSPRLPSSSTAQAGRDGKHGSIQNKGESTLGGMARALPRDRPNCSRPGLPGHGYCPAGCKHQTQQLCRKARPPARRDPQCTAAYDGETPGEVHTASLRQSRNPGAPTPSHSSSATFPPDLNTAWRTPSQLPVPTHRERELRVTSPGSIPARHEKPHNPYLPPGTMPCTRPVTRCPAAGSQGPRHKRKQLQCLQLFPDNAAGTESRGRGSGFPG